MSNDKAFLEFIYYRLVNVYGENPLCDYMQRLKTMVDNTKEDDGQTED